MGIWSVLSGLVEPVVKLIDELHTSDEERLQIKAQMMQVQSGIASEMIKYERQLLDARSKVVLAEAQGQSWLQRSWRPIVMLTFLVLVVADSFGFTTYRLAHEAWTLLQIGLGGYVVGRSAEKVLPQVAGMMKKQ